MSTPTTERKTRADSPPELLDTIYVDDPLDIFHPSLSCRPTRCCWVRSLGKRCHRSLWQISTFRRRRIEPQRPRRIERMLKHASEPNVKDQPSRKSNRSRKGGIQNDPPAREKNVKEEKKKRVREPTRTLTLKFFGSLNTVLSVSAWRAISTSISWTSPGSEDSRSERAAFNAALEAWSAGAGSELCMEEDIKISK